MDEHNDMDVSASVGNFEESRVRVSEHVASESETLVESTVRELQCHDGKVEGPIIEEGGSCNREDKMMVYVAGSHVFVDGVCTSDSGVRVEGEEKTNDGQIHGCDQSGEAGFERDLRSLDGADDVVGDLGSKKVGVTAGEASSNHGFEIGVGGPLVQERVTGEVVERGKEVVGDEGKSVLVDELRSQADDVLNDEVQNGRTATAVEGSAAVVGSTGGETQAVHVEDIVMLAREEGLERGLVRDDVERGSEMVGTAGREEWDHGAENGVGSSTVVPSTLNVGTEVLVVKEVVAMESENALRKEDAVQGSERNAGGEDTHQDVETRKFGVSVDVIWNPGIQAASPGSSAIVEDSSVQTQVIDEATVVVNEEGLNPNDDSLDNSLMKWNTSSSEEKKISTEECLNRTDDAPDNSVLEGVAHSSEEKQMSVEEPLNPKDDSPDKNVVEGITSSLEEKKISTEEFLNPKDDAPGSSVMEGVAHSSEEKQISNEEGLSCEDNAPGSNVTEVITSSSEEKQISMGLNSKDDTPGSNAMEGITSSSEEKQISMGLNPKDDAPGGNAMEGITCTSEEKQISVGLNPKDDTPGSNAMEGLTSTSEETQNSACLNPKDDTHGSNAMDGITSTSEETKISVDEGMNPENGSCGRNVMERIASSLEEKQISVEEGLNPKDDSRCSNVVEGITSCLEEKQISMEEVLNPNDDAPGSNVMEGITSGSEEKQISNEEGLNPKVYAPGISVTEGTTSSSEEKKISVGLNSKDDTRGSNAKEGITSTSEEKQISVEKGMHSEDDSRGRNVMEGITSSLEEKQILVEEGLNPEDGPHGSNVMEGITSSLEEKHISMEEVMNPKDDAPGSNVMEGITSGLAEKHISMAEIEDGAIGKDRVVNSNPKFLHEQTPVTDSGEVATTDDGDFMCSAIEGMETDTFDENLSFSLEELQGKIETADGSTENHYNDCADLTSSGQPIQVVGGEFEAMDKGDYPNSEEDQQFKFEGSLDQGIAHDFSQADSNVERAMEVDEQVPNAEMDGMLSCSGSVQDLKAEALRMGTEIGTEVAGGGEEVPLMYNREASNSNIEVQGPAANDTEQVSSDERQEIKDQKQLIMVETVGGIPVNHMNARSASVSTGLPTHEVAGGEVMPADEKVPSNPTIEVSYSVNVDTSLSCLGNDQNLKAEVVCGNIEIDSQLKDGGLIAAKDREIILDSNVEDMGPAGGDKSTASDFSEVKKHISGAKQVGLHGGLEVEVEEQNGDTEQPKTIEDKFAKQTTFKPESSVKSHQASYQLPLEGEGEFCVSDLVWGKVRSHPWWPGQIYDPSDASEKAMKYHKKDSFLVAYFGDRTFAWVDASLLKPFYSHFSQVQKLSNSEVFQNAVSCALEEVSRRVELGLACSCISNDDYDKIRFQTVENAGIRQESTMRNGVDKFASAHTFQPDKLIEYMKALAQSPFCGADRLELVMAKAQLLSFYRLKGYCQLPEFQFCGELVEDDVTLHLVDRKHPTPDDHISSNQGILETRRGSYHKRKHNLKDSMYPSKKERTLSELMTGSFDSLDDGFGSDGKAISKLASPSAGKKRKTVDSAGDDSSQDGRKTISLAKVSITTPLPKPSFKIGECIRRVASQMTGSPSILKCNSERLQKLDEDGPDVSCENFVDADGNKIIPPTDYSSLDDLLSQLQLAAQEPMKGYSFLNVIISFFSDFRNSIVLERHSVEKGGKRIKSSHSINGPPEAFEFEDMSDTYWTDRVIQNGAEEQPPVINPPATTPPGTAPTGVSPPSTNNRGGYKIVSVDLVKPVQKSRRSRKQYSDGNHDTTPAKPPGYVDENAPAELLMNFSEVDPIPSETNLTKMFRRFGPIKESETEVDRETSRARVVFKRCSDAEVAYSSATKFSIFGSIIVNYQLNYSISIPFKTSPIAITPSEENAT